MSKKFLSGLLSAFMVLGFFSTNILNVNAAQINPKVVVQDLPKTSTKSVTYPASFNGESANAKVSVTLNYMKHVVGTDVSYDSFSSSVSCSSSGSFTCKKYGEPTMSINRTSKTVVVTGEVQIFYNSGDYVNRLVSTKTYSLTYTLS